MQEGARESDMEAPIHETALDVRKVPNDTEVALDNRTPSCVTRDDELLHPKIDGVDDLGGKIRVGILHRHVRMPVLGDMFWPGADQLGDEGRTSKVKLANQLKVYELKEGIINAGWFTKLFLHHIRNFHLRKVPP